MKDDTTSNAMTQSTMMTALGWAYEKAVNGVPGLDTATDLANSYMREGGTPIEQVNSMIRWQNTKAGTSGFITGLGGLVTMPITVPANIASVLYVQLRMVAAIAHIGGRDVRDDKVVTLAYACLLGNEAKDIIKDVGIVVGSKLATKAIERISRETIVAINQRVGFRLLTKFGEKGLINLGKAIPLVGGLISATLDVVATNSIGNVARDVFIAS